MHSMLPSCAGIALLILFWKLSLLISVSRSGKYSFTAYFQHAFKKYSSETTLTGFSPCDVIFMQDNEGIISLFLTYHTKNKVFGHDIQNLPATPAP